MSIRDLENYVCSIQLSSLRKLSNWVHFLFLLAFSTLIIQRFSSK